MNIKINKLTENIFSLISLKGLQYILYFLLLPYLLHTLGATKYGTIIFVQNIVGYFLILVDYGFNFTAPRDISKSTTEEERNKKFMAIIFTKIFIAVCITLLFFIVNMFFNIIHNEIRTLFLFSYLLVIGNIIFPVWFFQGIQQMKYITIINFISKCIVVFFIFFLVKQPEDYILASFFLSAETSISGIFSLYLIKKKFPNIFSIPNINMIKEELLNGWSLFISAVSINIYTTSNIVFLGLITNNTIVGYFSAANKIIDGIKGIMAAITQAVYPYISELLKRSKEETLKFIRKFCKIYVFFSFICSISMFFATNIVVNILFGYEYEITKNILKILSFIPAIISISNIYGIQLMVNFGKQNYFSKILLIACIIDCLLIYPMIYNYKGTGVAIMMIIVESFVTISCLKYVKYNMKINIIKD